MKTHIGQVLLLSAAAFAVSPVDENSGIPAPCKVRAWVRAEDLSPDHTSRGELRIKASRVECADQIVSVALRLQLDEFGQVKFLKKGAVVPQVQASNQTAPIGYSDWTGLDVVLDYQAHDDAMSNPELWTVKAEERRAWMTEALLIDNDPDLSQPIVAPFTVAVPAVNYPPVINKYRNLDGPVERYSSSDLGYRYIAVVKFTDGRIEDVLAGHTTFVPSSETRPQQVPCTANKTFAEAVCGQGDSHPALNRHAEELENCLPEAQRSTFVAEVTLENGNVVQKGQTLKGRVTVRATDGFTVMSRLQVSVSLGSLSDNHWAQAQAADAGDADFYNATSRSCYGNEQALDPESMSFIFDEENESRHIPPSFPEDKEISFTKPYLDFELEVPSTTPVNFASYYYRSESFIRLRLSVLCSLDVAKGMKDKFLDPLEEKTPIEDSAKIEEGLWDMYTRIGKPRDGSQWRKPRDGSVWRRILLLHATVPVVVVSNSLAHPVPHYLAPGALSPVLRGGAEVGKPPLFPVAQPVINVEALAKTSARLMQSGSTDPIVKRQQFMNHTHWATFGKNPDPTKDYRGGSYAGLLWKKKIVAEERGIWPVRAEIDEGGDNNSRFPLPIE